MADTSMGEVGGIFAGIIAGGVALGHGLRWLLGWEERRGASRSAKLDAWQRELDARERRFDDQQAEHWHRVEMRLNYVQDQNTALLSGYQLLSAALRAHDPENPALRQADELLKAAWPLEPVSPPDMLKTVIAARRTDDQPPEGTKR